MKNKDFIIVLAWPELRCKLPGSWYDFFFWKTGTVRGGHSAIILVDAKSRKLYYMDNGRYHAPLGYSRIRDEKSDHDVKITMLADIKNDKILNIEHILKEAHNKKANHGEGTLYASVLSKVNFKSAYSYAKNEQKKGAIPYGPFIINGTNCSRFVASTIIHSGTSLITKLRLKYPFCIVPTPKRNVSTCNRNYYVVNDSSCKKVKRSLVSSYLKSIERK
tara:strand:+ start:363 stop:1019 length:657 start_codon:yes stop_codon:yes gene_type:complete